MAIDKAIDSTAFDSKLTTVADAIRTAGGTTEPMSFPSGMVEAISALKSGNIETITFTPANTGELPLDFETTGTPLAVVCVRNSFIFDPTDTYYYEKNEVPMCCILIGQYNTKGRQFPFHIYNSSTSYFSYAVYKYGDCAVNTALKANKDSVAVIKYNWKHPILSVYVNSTGLKGLRVGETYTAICLFGS